MPELIFDKLQAEFKVSADPEEVVTLWRGDKIGRAATGMMCRLGDSEAAEHFTYEVARRGPDSINDIIAMQTDAHVRSPLISVTNSIARAQGYATRADETIYKLEVPAKKLIKDPYAIGRPGKGNDTELFVIGAVRPDEIVAIKANNDDVNASEFLEPHEQTGKVVVILRSAAHILGDHPDDPSKEPNRFGVWLPPEALAA